MGLSNFCFMHPISLLFKIYSSTIWVWLNFPFRHSYNTIDYFVYHISHCNNRFKIIKIKQIKAEDCKQPLKSVNYFDAFFETPISELYVFGCILFFQKVRNPSLHCDSSIEEFRDSFVESGLCNLL